MTTTVSQELSGALRYAGDVRGERIEMPDLFEFWLDGCAALDADVQFSESWRKLQMRTVQIARREQLLTTVEGFAFEVGLDFRKRGSADRWRTLDVVAPERASDAEGLDRPAVSFYGLPRSVILSFEPDGYEFRLWYVAAAPTEVEALTEEPALNPTFAPLRKLLAAHSALPHAGHDDTTHARLERVILRGLEIWMPRWRRFAEKPLKREGSRSPGHRATTRGRPLARPRGRY